MTRKIMDYDQFIAGKLATVPPSGFEPLPFLAPLFDWQQQVVAWALRRGRAAMFEDCGLGKTRQQLEWARQVNVQTGKPVLILCPLAVAEQTVAEGDAVGICVHHVRQPEELTRWVNITNYDRLELFMDRIPELGGVVLDESSILKNFTGKTRKLLTEAFARTPFRLCCTATPAPNDFTELGQHADFLGICSPAQMLATYFINDTFDTGTWRLKKHAEEAFWQWVASWAVCFSTPEDIGFARGGFDLPPLEIVPVYVDVDERAECGEELFRSADLSATAMTQEMRRTLAQRVAAVRALVESTQDKVAVWCNLNEEQDALEEALPGAMSVRGSDRDEHKTTRERLWRTGEPQAMISKGSIFGYGMNWQHCHRLIVFPSYSYEDFYQILRRFYRFGQTRPVVCHVVLPRTASRVMQLLTAKQTRHETMKAFLRHSRLALAQSTPKTPMNTTIETTAGDGWTLHHGDCVRVAREKIADASVGFSVFSPPFADLFTYSGDVQDMGNCTGLDEFMQQFGYLIDELTRVTMPGRECAVHCCDLLATKWKDGAIELKDFSGVIARAFRERGWLFHSRITIWKSPVTEMQRTKAHGLLYKTLLKDSSDSRVGVPDYLLCFRKRGENPVPIKREAGEFPLDLWQEIASPVWMTVDQGRVLNGTEGRDQRDERHICPLQLDVIERALMLWSGEGDLVFSPFTGIGSEGYCARKMRRRFVGAELKRSYYELALANLKTAVSESVDLFSAKAA